MGGRFKTLVRTRRVHGENKILIGCGFFRNSDTQQVEQASRRLPGNWPPFQCEATQAGNYILCRSAVDHPNIERGVRWVEIRMRFAVQLFPNLFEARDQTRGSKYG